MPAPEIAASNSASCVPGDLHFPFVCVPVPDIPLSLLFLFSSRAENLQGKRYASILLIPAALAALYEPTKAVLTAPPYRFQPEDGARFSYKLTVEHDCPYPLSTTF